MKNIDWESCSKYNFEQLTKTICSEWNNKNINDTTKDIVIKLNLNRAFVINRLEVGTLLGFCSYNPKEESKKFYNSLKKKVEIFAKDGKSLGIFNSAKDIENCSIEEFGVILKKGMIQKVCKGKRKTYKNFIFKYVQ